MITPLDLVQGAKVAGLDAICLTEHDYVWTVDELDELGHEHGLLILRGMEVTTGRGHMLVFGLEDYVHFDPGAQGRPLPGFEPPHDGCRP